MATSTAAAGGSEGVWCVRLGPGARLAGLEPLLASLAGRVNARLATDVRALDDLADLVSGRFPGAGRLILDADHLLQEEIGFVRRFVTRHPAWRVVLVGEDAARQSARTVLALDGTSWLSWPPDLEQLQGLVRAPAALVPPLADSAAATRDLRDQAAHLADAVQRLELAFAALREAPGLPERQVAACTEELERLHDVSRQLQGRPSDTEPAAPAAARRGPAATHRDQGGEVLDLSGLLEEELAALTVRGQSAPRFLFRSGGALPVRGRPDELRGALREVLLLARASAQPGDVLRVQTQPEADGGASIEVDAPVGPLEGLSRREWLDPTSLAARLPDLDAEALAGALDVLAAHGARVEAGPEGDERQRLRLVLRRAGEGQGSGSGARAGRSAAPSVVA